jgi:hypothetical protein
MPIILIVFLIFIVLIGGAIFYFWPEIHQKWYQWQHPYWSRQPVYINGTYRGPEDLSLSKARAPPGYTIVDPRPGLDGIKLPPGMTSDKFAGDLEEEMLDLLNSSYNFTDDYRHVFTAEWLRRYNAPGASIFYIRHDTGTLAGLIAVRSIKIDEYTFGYVDSLCVSPAHRKQGLCESLIDCCKYAGKWDRFVFRKEGSPLPINHWWNEVYYYRQAAGSTGGSRGESYDTTVKKQGLSPDIKWLDGVAWADSFIEGAGGERFCEILHIDRGALPGITVGKLDEMCRHLGFTHYYISGRYDVSKEDGFKYSSPCYYYIFNHDMRTLGTRPADIIF